MSAPELTGVPGSEAGSDLDLDLGQDDVLGGIADAQLWVDQASRASFQEATAEL